MCMCLCGRYRCQHQWGVLPPLGVLNAFSSRLLQCDGSQVNVWVAPTVYPNSGFGRDVPWETLHPAALRARSPLWSLFLCPPPSTPTPYPHLPAVTWSSGVNSRRKYEVTLVSSRYTCSPHTAWQCLICVLLFSLVIHRHGQQYRLLGLNRFLRNYTAIIRKWFRLFV